MKLRPLKNRSYIIVTILCLMSGALGCSSGGNVDQLVDLYTRRIDGSQNNLNHSSWGSAGEQLARMAPAAYSGGVSSLAGIDRPNPRLVSNSIFAQSQSIPNDRGLSNYVWQWGQFLDHDISLTPDDRPEGNHPGQPSPISVPIGDPFFDPVSTGLGEIAYFRSVFDPSTGIDAGNPRQQVNRITAWIDGSQVYGSDPDRAAWLREGVGGRLRVSPGNFLPFNDGTIPNAPDSDTGLLVAGDVRANEQTALTALHILFMREHNRMAEEIQGEHPDWSDEQIYQRARKYIGAYIEVISFDEFLPALLGPFALGPYPGYDPEMDPTIFNEFSTAFFRFGHTMLPSELSRLDENGDSIPAGPLELRNAFFDPSQILEPGALDAILRGLAADLMEEVDALMLDDVRNFLFGPPGGGGLDLASLNIQRGRDHGLPDYNTLRQALGLTPITDFSQITSDAELAQKLADLYGDVNTIDPWVGALAEDLLPGASLGETLEAALSLQFESLRMGDRFWCERDDDFSPQEMQEILDTSLADIIRRNTGVKNIQDNVFFVP